MPHGDHPSSDAINMRRSRMQCGLIGVVPTDALYFDMREGPFYF
jgi:hypothetical protein